MRVEFEKLSESSRIWIFQSSALIKEETGRKILEEIDQFLLRWAAHGADLMASASLEQGSFLIIAIDEDFNMASGCSIDSMTRFVQELAQKYDINLLDRTKLAFLKNDEVILKNMSEMKELVEHNFFDSDTKYFNNNLQTKGQLKSDWLVKPEESWLKRYFQTVKSVL